MGDAGHNQSIATRSRYLNTCWSGMSKTRMSVVVVELLDQCGYIGVMLHYQLSCYEASVSRCNISLTHPLYSLHGDEYMRWANLSSETAEPSVWEITSSPSASTLTLLIWLIRATGIAGGIARALLWKSIEQQTTPVLNSCFSSLSVYSS